MISSIAEHFFCSAIEVIIWNRSLTSSVQIRARTAYMTQRHAKCDSFLPNNVASACTEAKRKKAMVALLVF